MILQQHTLQTIVEKLNAEPPTHLTLGHRELFHSNLLAWFFDYLPAEADKVFGPLTESETTGKGEIRRRVEREKKHIDLSFTWPNRCPLKIELKVFSLPDETQLTRYTKESGVTKSCFYLLSLSSPNWENDQQEIRDHKWRWLSFQKLAELIRSALPPDNPSYEDDPMRHYSIETMRHYARVVDLLHELVAKVAVMESDETVWLPNDVKTALKGNRLISSMGKLRASYVEQHVRKALHEAGVESRNAKTNMTRSKPLIEWFCSINDDWEVGWQIQEGQFRLAMRVKEGKEKLRGRGANAQSMREAFAGRNESFFNFASLDDTLITQNNHVSKFHHFDPDFVYRFKKVPNLTIDQLKRAAVIIAQRPRAVFP